MRRTPLRFGPVFVAGLALASIQPVNAAVSDVSGTVAGMVASSEAPDVIVLNVSGLTAEVGNYGYVGWLIDLDTEEALNVGVVTNGLNALTNPEVLSPEKLTSFRFMITLEPIANSSDSPLGEPVAVAESLPADGVALQSTMAGEIDVTANRVIVQVDGLPALPDGHRYVAWLYAESSGDALRLGPIDAIGSGDFAVGDIGAGGFTAFIITAEPDGGTSSRPQGEVFARGDVGETGSEQSAVEADEDERDINVVPPGTGHGGLLDRQEGSPTLPLLILLVTLAGIGAKAAAGLTGSRRALFLRRADRGDQLASPH